MEYKLTDDQRVGNLYEVLKSYAPNKDALKICQNLIQRQGVNSKENVRELVSAIYDGLAYGNWPWVLQSLKGKK
jgi:hypothetical protein